jgi:hypothetical protein
MSLEIIGQYKDLIGFLAAIGAGFFAFIKWLDARNRELKERRYKTYMELVGVISGKRPDATTSNFTEQIAAVWFLLEYKEYRDITNNIFSGGDLSEIGSEEWVKYIVPHIQKMLRSI